MDSECVLCLMDTVESSEQERRAQMQLECCVCLNPLLHRWSGVGTESQSPHTPVFFINNICYGIKQTAQLFK